MSPLLGNTESWGTSCSERAPGLAQPGEGSLQGHILTPAEPSLSFQAAQPRAWHTAGALRDMGYLKLCCSM